MPDFDRFKIDEKQKRKLNDFDTSIDDRPTDEELQQTLIPESIERLKELHWKLYAEAKTGVVVVLQALDAGGKDEAISYIFSNLNAQGLKTNSL